MSDLYHCTYKKVFPIDEYGRLGGLYSLADLPIMEHKEVIRSGVIVEKNEEEQFYKVRDTEKNFEEFGGGTAQKTTNDDSFEDPF